MGEIISMQDARRRRAKRDALPLAVVPRGSRSVTFWFDLRGLGGAATYLAAERVDRQIGRTRWRPALVDRPGRDAAATWRALDARARALGMPLLEPADVAGDGLRAMRVAHHAAAQDRASQFVLAIGRMAFCGGYDLDDFDVLAEAAEAAGLDHHEAIRAAGEVARDERMREAGDRLGAGAAPELPVLQVGELLLGGESRVAEAAAVARARAGTSA